MVLGTHSTEVRSLLFHAAFMAHARMACKPAVLPVSCSTPHAPPHAPARPSISPPPCRLQLLSLRMSPLTSPPPFSCRLQLLSLRMSTLTSPPPFLLQAAVTFTAGTASYIACGPPPAYDPFSRTLSWSAGIRYGKGRPPPPRPAYDPFSRTLSWPACIS